MKDAHVAELPGGAIIHDNCVEHRRKSYVCETGKSMKAVGLAVSQTGNCRNIAITLIDEGLTEEIGSPGLRVSLS